CSACFFIPTLCSSQYAGNDLTSQMTALKLFLLLELNNFKTFLSSVQLTNQKMTLSGLIMDDQVKNIIMLDKLPKEFHAFKTNVAMHFKNKPLKKLKDFASQNCLENIKRPSSPTPIQSMFPSLLPLLQEQPFRGQLLSKNTLTRNTIRLLVIHTINNTLPISLITPMKTKQLWNIFKTNTRTFISDIPVTSSGGVLDFCFHPQLGLFCSLQTLGYFIFLLKNFLPLNSPTCLNFNNPKVGKLKASKWNLLFSTYLPLSLIYFFFENLVQSTHPNMMINFLLLITCTNIVSMKSVTNDACRKLAKAYILYTGTSKKLFQLPKIVPNHHYALPCLTEVVGTSVSQCSFITVLREFFQLQRLQQQIPNLSLEDENSAPRPTRQRKLVEVHPTIYSTMFEKLNYKDSTLQNYKDGPHPDNSNILSWYAIEENEVITATQLYDSETWYGYVSHIYKLPDYQGRILVAVKVLVDTLFYDGLEASKSFWQTVHDLELSLVREERMWELLDPSELVAVCAYWPLKIPNESCPL
ncbi:hypothetical protein VP01_1574g1, partial [Puccinia sorghi]